jgi:hypothetical protein
MNKGITAKILEILSDEVAVSSALFQAIMESGYGASYGQLQRNFKRIIGGRQQHKKPDSLSFKKHNFYLILSKLKREGLVKNKEGKWSITSIGREKLAKLVGRMPRVRYKKETDSTLKIVIFDVPEKEQHKRAWLRRRLVELGFKMLQKSVWAGRVKLPEEFLEDLREYKIFPYVDIFAVTKTGSIRPIS